MFQRVLPRASFECELPEGWFLSRIYKGNRILYYNDVKVARVADTFDIENAVQSIIANPPAVVQPALYKAGLMKLEELNINAQKKLVKQGVISYDTAVQVLPHLYEWLSRNTPSTVEYDGQVFRKKHNQWYDADGNPLRSMRFTSIWDARVRYAARACTLSEVAEYSWAAVLECIGDDHQRYINTVLNPKLSVNKKACVYEAKLEKSNRLAANEKYRYTEFDNSDVILSDYKEAVGNTLMNYFNQNVHNHTQMFTEKCNVPAFSDVAERVKIYEQKLRRKFSRIKHRVGHFRWNSLLKSYEPVLVPQKLNTDKLAYFYDLLHRTIIGEISGHQAALCFTNGDMRKITREYARYTKQITQYIPYYNDRWKKLRPEILPFKKAVSYVKNSIKELITLGYRDNDKNTTQFVYDGCRFLLDVDTGVVTYLGYAGGDYMSERWLHLKPEQRRKLLQDDIEWEYQEKAIKKYNRLFSFLNNVIHKHWDKLSYIVKDKAVAKHKYLRPSTGFLNKLKMKADKYIKSLERRVVSC